ncbi:Transcriptional modulator of MazE/toxin, MazF [Candidatus Desulfarcum epimagneticum]|uniref:Transcriptional modulator of MazE/toxin, MazF n=1 Tax=uncultured Desulfobacteraceae bacterium TaxID=218296 RepID=A0A484HDZ2_9BACT|nr:Transcriptional modulator of MazE/toxin, MazF [uncultured Desulfobacteraceae bacterium]
MKRGELYRVRRPSSNDPKKFRVFVIVSRQILIDSRFSTAICAPVYTTYDNLSTQVPIGINEGLKHDSSIHCDELMSLPKSMLTHYVGKLPSEKSRLLDRALIIALQLYNE